MNVIRPVRLSKNARPWYPKGRSKTSRPRWIILQSGGRKFDLAEDDYSGLRTDDFWERNAKGPHVVRSAQDEPTFTVGEFSKSPRNFRENRNRLCRVQKFKSKWRSSSKLFTHVRSGHGARANPNGLEKNHWLFGRYSRTGNCVRYEFSYMLLNSFCIFM